jgi:hypothetical protein
VGVERTAPLLNLPQLRFLTPHDYASQQLPLLRQRTTMDSLTLKPQELEEVWKALEIKDPKPFSKFTGPSQ